MARRSRIRSRARVVAHRAPVLVDDREGKAGALEEGAGGPQLGEGSDARRGAAGDLGFGRGQRLGGARSAYRRRGATPGTGRRVSGPGGSGRARRAGRCATASASAETTRSRLLGREGQQPPASPTMSAIGCRRDRSRRTTRSTCPPASGRREGGGLPISAAIAKLPVDRREPLDDVVGGEAEEEISAGGAGAKRAPAAPVEQRSVEDAGGPVIAAVMGLRRRPASKAARMARPAPAAMVGARWMSTRTL